MQASKTMVSAEILAGALGGKWAGSGWIARCPTHDDRTHSLSVRDGEQGILVHCHAGCTQENVISALRSRGLWPAGSPSRSVQIQSGFASPGEIALLKSSNISAISRSLRGNSASRLRPFTGGSPSTIFPSSGRFRADHGGRDTAGGHHSPDGRGQGALMTTLEAEGREEQENDFFEYSAKRVDVPPRPFQGRTRSISGLYIVISKMDSC